MKIGNGISGISANDETGKKDIQMIEVELLPNDNLGKLIRLEIGKRSLGIIV